MRAELTAAVDRRLVRLIRNRARRNSLVVRLVPARWLGPMVAPRIRRLRIRLTLAALGLSLLLVVALLVIAV